MTGGLPKRGLDHANGDGLDNRWCNLRLATYGQNSANAGKRSNNTSGRKGVTWSKRAGKWEAQIQVAGRHLYHRTL